MVKTLKAYPEMLAILLNKLNLTAIPRTRTDERGAGKLAVIVNFDTDEGRRFMNRAKIGQNLDTTPIYTWAAGKLMIPQAGVSSPTGSEAPKVQAVPIPA